VKKGTKIDAHRGPGNGQKQLGLHIDQGLYTALKTEAEKHDRSAAGHARWLLRQAMILAGHKHLDPERTK